MSRNLRPAGPPDVWVFVVTLGVLMAGSPVIHGQFVEDVTILHSWGGENFNDRFGFINRVIGDLDGDGVVEIGVSSIANSEGGTVAGKVYVFSGASGALLRTHIGRSWWNLGYEIAGVGDVDRDGVLDYVVGAPSGTGAPPVGPGQAFLYSGADGSVLHTWSGEVNGDLFGTIVVGAGNTLDGGVGDINGDGIPDVLISAPGRDAAGFASGRVYVYSGADPDTALYVIDGEATGDTFGWGVGGLGDVNKDGFGDFVIGAPQFGNAGGGRVYVYSGATGQLLFPPFTGDATSGGLGSLFTSGPGDVNADGTLDVFVSDLGNSVSGPATGRVYILSGVDGSPIRTFTGSAAGEGFGVGRGCGDVNFDGHPDVLIAAFTSSALLPQAGRAFVYSGRDGSVIRTITNSLSFDQFGWSAVGAASDLNGDGALDFIVSAHQNDQNEINAGRVYVISGDLRQFVRGDADTDGSVDGLRDGVYLLTTGLLTGDFQCLDSADSDGDGIVNALVDALFILEFQFLGGPPPGEPFPSCGLPGGVASPLGCETYDEPCL